MTHPPATCELCGDTGLYTPSALPCPKGCKDIVERLVKIAEASRREDGSLIPLGQEIADAVEYITNMRMYISEMDKRLEYATEIVIANEGLGAALSEAEQREKDAREKALDDAAQAGYVACAETRHVTLGYKVAAAIRALKDDVR